VSPHTVLLFYLDYKLAMDCKTSANLDSWMTLV